MKECFIFGILGGFIGTLYMGWLVSSKWPQAKDPTLAVVDMQALISKKSQQLATSQLSEKLTLNPHISKNSLPIQEAAAQLKEELRMFAMAHNLILLTKTAIVSGEVPDKTEEILEIMEKGAMRP